MFSKTKLRARLILDGKKLKSFIYIFTLYFLRLFFITAGLFCAVSLVAIPLLVTKTEFNEGKSYWIFIYIACVLMVFLSVFFYIRLRIARQRFFEKIMHKGDDENRNIGFKNDIKLTFRVMLSVFLSGLVKLMWLLFYLLPSLAAAAYIYFRVSSQNFAANVFFILLGGTCAAAAFGLLFWFCTIQRYSLMLKLSVTKDLNAAEALRQSVEFTNGFSAASALFRLSLIPWYLLCVLLVPVVYVVPYCCLSLELFGEKCIAKTPPKPSMSSAAVLSITKKLPQI